MFRRSSIYLCEALEVSVQLQKHKPNCPKLWQLPLLSCLPAEVPSFLILAALLARDHPKAVLVLLSLCRLHCALQCGVPHVQPQLALLSTSVASLTSVKLSSELVTLYLCLLPVKHSSRSWTPTVQACQMSLLA